LPKSIFKMQGNYRKNIRPGLVRDILTNAPQHPHGIKVRLDTGEVGRVKEILDEEEEIEWPE
jgi:uncharacterized protein YwbE